MTTLAPLLLGRSMRGPSVLLLAVLTAAAGLTPAAATGSAHVAVPRVTNLSLHRGADTGGQVVTVMGERLTAVRGVTVGGTAATVIRRGVGPAIVIRIPAHAPGYGEVSVLTDHGRSIGTGMAVFQWLSTLPEIRSVSPSVGLTSGGNPVTITGPYMNHPVQVVFGGMPAAIISWTSTSIVVRAPAHAPARTYVKVRTARGVSRAAFDGTYEWGVAPTVTAVNRDEWTRTYDDLTVTGTAFTYASRVFVGGVEVESSHQLDGTHISFRPAAATPSGPAVVQVRTEFGLSAPAPTVRVVVHNEWKVLGNARNARQISCSSRQFCVAANGGEVWNGRFWLRRVGTDRGVFDAISCPVDGLCIAGSYGGGISTYRDGQWAPPQMIFADRSSVSGISCLTDGWCMAMDHQNHWSTRQPNGTWSAPGDGPVSVEPLYASLTCASRTLCFAFHIGSVLRWDGTAWTLDTTVSGRRWATAAVGCVTGQDYCLAMTDDGAFAWSGGSWTPVAGHYSVPETQDVSCVSPEWCLAVGSVGTAEILDHGHWTDETVDQQRVGEGVDCVDPQFCLVAAGDRVLQGPTA